MKTSSRDAMIIATGAYQDPELRRLRAPVHDADALARVLRDPAIGGFNVQPVVDQPEKVVRREAHRFFANRGLDDLLLVHLSCHGVKDDDGRLYFAAADTEKKWLASTGVPASYLNELMEECRARSIVLLLDCCYSGAFLPGAKGDKGVHLKEKFEGEGRVVLTASNAIEYSWEGTDLSGEGAPSVFTAAIVDGLESGKADRDRDGMVSIHDLYKHVYERVRAERRGQTPKMWALGIEHDLYVARNPRPIEVEPAPLPRELQGPLESPLASVRAGIVEDLARLLSSTDRGLVVAVQQALERLQHDDSRRVSSAAQRALEDHQEDAGRQVTIASSRQPTREPAERGDHGRVMKENRKAAEPVGEPEPQEEPPRPAETGRGAKQAGAADSQNEAVSDAGAPGGAPRGGHFSKENGVGGASAQHAPATPAPTRTISAGAPSMPSWRQHLRARPRIVVGIGIAAILILIAVVVINLDSDAPTIGGGSDDEAVSIVDDFSTRENGWDDVGGDETGGRYEGGTYQISALREDGGGWGVIASPRTAATAADLRLKVDARRIDGTASRGFGYGIFCRADGSDNLYAFTIWKAHANLAKLTDGNYEPLGEPNDAVTAAEQGDTKKELQAVCATVEGESAVDLQLLVDGEMVLRYKDEKSPHESGTFGLHAVLGARGAIGETLKVEFDNFEASEE